MQTNPLEKRNFRMMMAQENGPQEPLQQCKRAELCDQPYCGHDAMLVRDAEMALQQCDRNLEICHDLATSGNNMSPGYHVYRVVQRAGVRSEDKLALVFSLQYDMSKTWPHGGPRVPGRWLVDAYKKFDTSNIAEDDDPVEQAITRHKKNRKAKDDEIREAESYFKREMKSIKNGGDKRARRIANDRKKKESRKKTKKTTYGGQKVKS